uniref:hypothetical protein n=1 Tax=Lithothamnion corallioides TaxID=1277934 RepID=UPI0023F3DC88|nr:hypothetical protein P6G75_pgp057 [Lithothamnion corallioides]WEA77138.1 hypothetical protein [Lithothamnion corallioides]
MLLFNLIFAQTFFKLPDYLLVRDDNQLTIGSYKYKQREIYLSSLPCLTLNADFLTQSKESLADQKLIPSNLFKRFIDKFWQQKIVLSVPTKISEKYIADLNSLNLVKHKVSQKKFLSQFSKSLINGSIESSLSSNLFNDQTSSSIIYVWKKVLNLKKLMNFNLPILNASKKSLREIKKQLEGKLKIKNLPLFIVTNHLGQMVIAEPPEVSNVGTSIIGMSFQASNLRPCYEGWFFINFQDAEEYLQHIKKQYSISDTSDKLQVFICNLETFYKLSLNSRNVVHFRLVPDLHEIGQLVNNYSSYLNVRFNKNQNYGKDYFQGQPIYTIKIKNEGSDYYYPISRDDKQIKYKPVFMNYKTAIYSWNNFVKKQKYSRLLKHPELIVYNLEDFLEEQISDSKHNQLPFLLIPSKSSYEFTKNSQFKKTQSITSTYFSYFKLWTKRIFWSLTSRQPQDW